MSTAAVAVGTVFTACNLNVLSLEYITNTAAGRQFGVGLTALQFGVVGVASLYYMFARRGAGAEHASTSLWRRFCPFEPRPVTISITWLLLLTLFFWLLSTANNMAFGYNISVPVHTVFRSSSLVFNLIIGFIFFGQRFHWQQVLCAIVVTAGLITLTLAVSQVGKKGAAQDPAASGTADRIAAADYAIWLQGIAILIFTSILSPALGVLQDRALKVARSGGSQSPKADNKPSPPPLWAQLMCITHLASVPLFFLADFAAFAYRHPHGEQSTVVRYLLDATPAVNGTGLSMPAATRALTPGVHGPLLLVNAATQFVCIRAVYTLTDVAGSFTMTLTLTLRKFISLVMSTFYFHHYKHFTFPEWIAIIVVALAGTAYPFLKKYNNNATSTLNDKKAISNADKKKAD